MRLLGVTARAQDHELLSAQTTEHIGAAQTLTDALAQAAQHMIAHRMTKLVVDAFEVIDIQHDDRQVLIVALSALKLDLQTLLEIAPVMDTGQRVGHRQRAQLFFNPFQIGDIGQIAVPQRTAVLLRLRGRLAPHPALTCQRQ
ncbi:hypothetical protein D3C76_938130 [compost metagenome]